MSTEEYDPALLRFALRAARLAAEMTQEEASARIGLNPSYISRVESGKEIAEPKFANVVRLAHAYGKPLEDLAAEAGLPVVRRRGGATEDKAALDPRLAEIVRVLQEGEPAWRDAVISAVYLMLAARP